MIVNICIVTSVPISMRLVFLFHPNLESHTIYVLTRFVSSGTLSLHPHVPQSSAFPTSPRPSCRWLDRYGPGTP